MTVKDIKIQDYTYTLPDERIAKFPLQERDASKLLIYNNGGISESTYRHIAAFTPADSCVFFNNTKVIPARLLFKRATGAAIEVFCLEPTTELASSMTHQGSTEWKCVVGNAKKWKEGEILSLTTEGGIELKAQMKERNREGFIVQFSWLPLEYVQLTCTCVRRSISYPIQIQTIRHFLSKTFDCSINSIGLHN